MRSEHSSMGSRHRYLTLRPVAILLTLSLLALLFCVVTAAVLYTTGNKTYPDFINPDAPISDQHELELLNTLELLSIAGLVAYLPCIVLVCGFMYRANSNLRSIGARGMEFTPGWCVGWWFVPIMNLFKPYQAMKEIDQYSREPRGGSWNSTAILPVWWTSWIVGCLASRIGGRFGPSSDALPLIWTAAILSLLSGTLLIGMVWRVVRNQSLCRQRSRDS